MAVGAGILPIKKVKSGGLYGAHIRGEAETHKDMRKMMMDMKRKNAKKYKKELKLEYYPLAFSECYKS